MASIAEASRGLVTIGLDPHPGSHTANAMNTHGRVLDELTVLNDESGWELMMEWSRQYPERRWAVEGPGNGFAKGFVEALLSRDEKIVSITPSMTAQYRGRRAKGKDDDIDAANAARVLLANEDLPAYLPMEYESDLKELTRSYQKIRTQLTAIRASSRTMKSERVRQALAKVIKSLEAARDDVKRELTRLAKRIAPEILKPKGIGPVVATTLLAEAGRVNRFPNKDHFASYCGAAPIRWQSGGSNQLRVNPGGNRRLNWAAHIVALGRLRTDKRTQDYRDRKLAEGKTQREVLRLLKTSICREFYSLLKQAQECTPHIQEVI
jgi:transposase